MTRRISGALCALTILFAAGPALAEESHVGRDAAEAGRAVGSTFRDIGQKAAKVGKDIGHGAAKVGKDIGHGAAKAGKEFARAVRGEKRE
jgi:hypothetical protein